MSPESLETVGYAQWGADFFRIAVTPERILGAVKSLAGRPIDFGPMGVGPAKLAKVSARGAIGVATVTPIEAPEVTFELRLPVALTFDLDLGLETHSFKADLEVPILLVAHALTGLRIFVDARPPRPDEVRVTLRGEGLRASVVSRVANIEGELRKFVAKYVGREIEKPEIRSARLIDVAAAIDGAYASISR